MGTDTRDRLIEATAWVLANEGIAAASARTIAQRAESNPALIYYHFENLPGLLAATSRAVTDARVLEYRRQLASVSTLTELAAAARQLHQQEHENGNLAMLAQLLAGARTIPEVGPALSANFELLATEVAGTLDRILGGTVLEGVIEARPIARAVSAGFIGIELVESIGDDREPAILDTLDTMAGIVDLVLSSGAIPTSLIRRRLRTTTAKR